MQKIETEINEVLNSDERILWIESPKFFPFLFSEVHLLITFLQGIFLLNIKSILSFFIVFEHISFIYFLGFIFIFYSTFKLFFHKLRFFSNTIYCITDQRVIIRAGSFNKDIETFFLHQINFVDLKYSHFFKAGNIRIYNRDRYTDSENPENDFESFYGIQHPEIPYKILNELIKKKI